MLGPSYLLATPASPTPLFGIALFKELVVLGVGRCRVSMSLIIWVAALGATPPGPPPCPNPGKLFAFVPGNCPGYGDTPPFCELTGWPGWPARIGCPLGPI